MGISGIKCLPGKLGRPPKIIMRADNAMQRINMKDKFEIAACVSLQVDKEMKINVSRHTERISCILCMHLAACRFLRT